MNNDHLFEHGFVINEAGEKVLIQMYTRRIGTLTTWRKIHSQFIKKDELKKSVRNMRSAGYNPINLLYQPFLNPH